MSKPNWIFTKHQIQLSPNMKLLKGHQFTDMYEKIKGTTFAYLMGEQLKLSSICIETAIVYLHRFYMFFSYKEFEIRSVCMAATFVACKTNHEFRRLEHVIKVGHYCLYPKSPPLDVNSETYMKAQEDLIVMEAVLLQILGFHLHVELPHPIIVKLCQIVKGGEEFEKNCYLVATASLMTSTFCLTCTPARLACICVNLGAEYSGVEIDLKSLHHPWFYYIDRSLSVELLNELTRELEKCITIGMLAAKSPVLHCELPECMSKELKMAVEKMVRKKSKAKGSKGKQTRPVAASSTVLPNSKRPATASSNDLPNLKKPVDTPSDETPNRQSASDETLFKVSTSTVLPYSKGAAVHTPKDLPNL